MTGAAKIAFIYSQAVCMLAEIEAFKAANAERAREGKAPAYSEDAFLDLAASYGLTHNQVIDYLRDT